MPSEPTEPTVEVESEEPATTTDRVWSPYQLAVFREVEFGRGNVAVRARAGSGKSTLLEELFVRIPRTSTALALTFGKSVQTALAVRIQRRGVCNVEARTFHSVGLSAVRRTFGQVEVYEDKVRDLLRDACVPAMFSDLGQRGSSDLRSAAQNLVRLAKNTLATTEDDLRLLVDRYGIDAGDEVDPDPVRAREMVVALSARAIGLCKEITSFVDQDDMVWFPAVYDLPVRQVEYVFVDEVQDLNAAQIHMLLRAARPHDGRTVVVGDDRQAVYAFRGADDRAFDRVVEALDAKIMPLSITYRCPRSVVRLARNLVSDLEAAPWAEDGSVEDATVEDLLEDARPGDFVLSRTNAPLAALCLHFLREGRRATILGRKVGDGLVQMVRRSRAATVADLIAWVESWRARKTAQVQVGGDGAEAEVDVANDRADTLLAIAVGCDTVAHVRTRLGALFSRGDGEDGDRDEIALSTTHQAKGLERDVVWLLRDTYLKRPGTEEQNLLYVAMTRARRTLRFVLGDPSKWRSAG